MKSPVEKVTGIGGVFLKSRDPEKTAAWYEQHLGIPAPEGHADFTWREKDSPEKIGRTVWSLFPNDTDYFGPSGSSCMINYRVENLERMLDQLRSANIVIHKVEDYDYGRFAWLSDPEGNRIELWEPK